VSHDRFSAIPAAWTDRTSLTGLLRAAYGAGVRRAWRRYSAEPVAPRDAELLDVPLGVPLLVLVGADRDEAGAEVVVAVRRSRGDRIEYVVTSDRLSGRERPRYLSSAVLRSRKRA
jgi:DNA-binding GntR family transcriptional regulator